MIIAFPKLRFNSETSFDFLLGLSFTFGIQGIAEAFGFIVTYFFDLQMIFLHLPAILLAATELQDFDTHMLSIRITCF